MELCGHYHETVCFAKGNCPVCEVKKDLQDEINGLKDEIDELNLHNRCLTDQVACLEQERAHEQASENPRQADGGLSQVQPKEAPDDCRAVPVRPLQHAV